MTRSHTMAGYLRGSFTFEAALIVPMILFCLAAMMGAGFDQARLFMNDLDERESVWEEEREEAPAFARIMRAGAEAASLIEAFTGDGGDG